MTEKPAALPDDIRPAVVGLGYVGLPLAAGFGRVLADAGLRYQCRTHRGAAPARDHTLEMSSEELRVGHATVVQRATRPTWRHAMSTSSPCRHRSIGSAARPGAAAVGQPHRRRRHRRGDVVIFESTVYPGATEEVCVPIIEQASGLRFNQDFYAGYSPERINPGDKQHRLESILKVTSGSTPEVGRLRRCPVSPHHHGRHPQGLQHPRGRGRQGDREHPARSQYRAGQRAGADLPAPGHRHRSRCSRPPAPNGISCRFARAWSAVTASASTRTT